MKIEELIDGGEQTAQNVRSVLNILLEYLPFAVGD